MAKRRKQRNTTNNSDLLVGGQALIEGVMMKGNNWLGIAVRKQDGSLKVRTKRFVAWKTRFGLFGWPFARGFINLLQMMIIGIQALTYSAEEAAEEDDGQKKERNKPKKKAEMAWWQIAFVLIFSFGFAILLFKFVPLFTAQVLSDRVAAIKNSSFLFSIVDGIIKIGLFTLYVYLISLLKDVRRVFQYHGAEHNAVYCYEAKKALTVKNVKKYATEHPRCGTSFVLGVLIISIIIYSLIPMDTTFLMKLFLRILLLPVIAGISYEILRLTAKHQHSIVFRFLTAPGLWTQKITTKKPDAKQIEVSISALNAVLRKEKAAI